MLGRPTRRARGTDVELLHDDGTRVDGHRRFHDEPQRAHTDPYGVFGVGEVCERYVRREIVRIALDEDVVDPYRTVTAHGDRLPDAAVCHVKARTARKDMVRP